MYVLEDCSLSLNDVLHNSGRVISRHFLIIFATHSERKNRLASLRSANAIIKEFRDLLLVREPVPASFGIFSKPLVGETLHGLVVGRRDADAVLIGGPFRVS